MEGAQSTQFTCARCEKAVLRSRSKDIQGLLCDDCLRFFRIWRKRKSSDAAFERCVACGRSEMSEPVPGAFDPYGCFCRQCYPFYADFVEQWMKSHADDLERADVQ